MTEESKVRDAVDAVTGLAKAVPVYNDVVQPAAQEVGKALQTVAKTVHIALAPVSALVWGYEQVKEFVSTKVADRLKNVPPENIVTPKPNVAGPALESLRYTGHEESLSDMYANLLAAAMDKSTASGAHPAFVEIIRQMTPDEARLMAYITSDEMSLPLITLRWEFKNPSPGREGGKDVFVNFSLYGEKARCEYSSMTPSYLDNLSRLGLIEMPAVYEYKAPGVYDELENHPVIQMLKAHIDANPEIRSAISRRGIRITELGKQFTKICVVKKE